MLFPDGTMSQYATNLLAENIWSQVDSEGNRYQLMDHILSHRVDNAAGKRADAWMVSKNGNKHRKRTTKGWYFEVLWTDGTSSWVPLKEIKRTKPLKWPNIQKIRTF